MEGTAGRSCSDTVEKDRRDSAVPGGPQRALASQISSAAQRVCSRFRWPPSRPSASPPERSAPTLRSGQTGFLRRRQNPIDALKLTDLLIGRLFFFSSRGKPYAGLLPSAGAASCEFLTTFTAHFSASMGLRLVGANILTPLPPATLVPRLKHHHQ